MFGNQNLKPKNMYKLDKIVILDRFLIIFRPDLSGHWSQLTGGRCLEVNLVLKLLGWDLGWSLLTSGDYSEVVVNTGLTVIQKEIFFEV
jgi:hypothetical protein